MSEIVLNAIEKIIFDFNSHNLNINEFEHWVYKSPDAETFFSPDDYLELISLNYSSKFIRNDIETIVTKYIDYGKFETLKITRLLHEAMLKESSAGETLIEFYYMYCDGYYFLEDLGLGFGLSCVVPPSKYSANSWYELSDDDKNDLINSFYPRIIAYLNRVLEWIMDRKVVIKGTKNDLGYWEYIDYRTLEEKQSKIVIHKKNDKFESAIRKLNQIKQILSK